MVIRNLAASWPPSVTIGTGEPANLEDSVVGANKKSEGHIVLMVRTGSGSVYGLLQRRLHLIKILEPAEGCKIN